MQSQPLLKDAVRTSLRLEREEWEKFVSICHKKDETPTNELRKFVKWTISKKGGNNNGNIQK
jgi:hypothetical protein